MYKSNYAKYGSLKNSSKFKMDFWRNDEELPRCQGLLKGYKSRDGLPNGYYSYNEKYVPNPDIGIILANILIASNLG